MYKTKIGKMKHEAKALERSGQWDRAADKYLEISDAYLKRARNWLIFCGLCFSTVIVAQLSTLVI